MIRIFLIIFCLLTAAPVMAENVYVSTCGDSTTYVPATDNCAGGSDRSYDTIQEAIDYVSAGDVIHIRAGTWNENVVMTGSTATGTDWDTPITMQGYSGDAMPIIEGGAGVALENQTAGNWYWIFKDLKFTRTYGSGGYTVVQTVLLHYGSYYKLDGCTIEGNLWTYTNGNITIDTCTFDGETSTWERATALQPQSSGVGTPGPITIQDSTFQNYSERGIWIYHASDNNIVTRNTVDNCATAIDIDNYGWTRQSDGNEVSYNELINNNHRGIEFENCTNSIMKYNLVSNVTAGEGNDYGLSVIDYDAYRGSNSNNIILGNVVYDTDDCGIRITEAYGTKIYNNTVYDNSDATGLIALKGVTYPCNNTDIQNNILYQPNSGQAALWFPAGTPSGITCDYNVYYNSEQTDVIYDEDSATWYTLAEWVAATAYDDNSIQDNPDFTNLGGNDFTLLFESPANDAGTIPSGFENSYPLDPTDTSSPFTAATGDYGSREIGAFRSHGITITATDSEAAEEGQATGTFRVTRTGTTSGNLVVSYTLGGTANEATDVDEDLSGGTLTILDGNTTVDQTITPTDDSDVEGQETLTMTIAANGYVIGSPSQAVIYIEDNESVEGEAGLVVFGVEGTGGMTINPDTGTGELVRQ